MRQRDECRWSERVDKAEKTINESMSGSRMESGRTRGGNKEDGDGRIDKKTESGGILVELREIRKVMEELVNDEESGEWTGEEGRGRASE